jgi:hypothetical protein
VKKGDHGTGGPRDWGVRRRGLEIGWRSLVGIVRCCFYCAPGMENYRQSLGKFVGGQAAGVRDQGSGGREKGPRLKLGALLGGFQEPEVSRSLRRPPCGGPFKLKLGTVPTGLRLDHGGDSYPTPRRGANKHCAYGAGYGVLDRK